MRALAGKGAPLRLRLVALFGGGVRGLLLAAVVGVATAALAVAFGLEAGLRRQAAQIVADWEGAGFLTSYTRWWRDESGRHRERNSITAAQFAQLVAAFHQRARFAAASMVWGAEAHGEASAAVEVVAAQPEYFTLQKWQFQSGYGFSEEDERQRAPVCVLGAGAAKALFPSGARPGVRVTVLGKPLVVRGILRAKGPDSHGEDRDALVVVPFATGTERLWSSEGVRSAYFAPVGNGDLNELSEEVAEELRRIRGVRIGEKQGFDVIFPKGLAAHYRSLYRTHRLVALAVAAFSCGLAVVVTSIVMRLHLAGRGREFGLKRALGATRGRLAREIIAESALFALTGAPFGSLIAGLLATLASHRYRIPGTQWSTLPLDGSWWGLLGANVATVLASVLTASWATQRFAHLGINEALRK